MVQYSLNTPHFHAATRHNGCLPARQDRQRCALRQSLEENGGLQRRLRSVLESLTRAQQKNGDLILAVKNVHLQRKLGEPPPAGHPAPHSAKVWLGGAPFAPLHAGLGTVATVAGGRAAAPSLAADPFDEPREITKCEGSPARQGSA